MAEYFVNPNVGFSAPMANAAPKINSAPVTSSMPSFTAPAAFAPQAMAAAPQAMPAAPYAMPAASHAYGCNRGLSAEAILVLFILLVIITRLCG